MAAGLRKMQENRGFSENRIDKSRFVEMIILYSALQHNKNLPCHGRQKRFL